MTLPRNARELARLANDLAFRCPASDTAFSVGAVIATAEGTVLASGYSRATGPIDHAEEVALADARSRGAGIEGAHVYVSLEPCGTRLSKPKSCAEILIEAGVGAVFYTASEPPVFVRQTGLELLTGAGVPCVKIDGYEDMFRRANAHLLAPRT